MNPAAAKQARAPVQVRGAHATTAIKWIREAYGEEVFQRILARLSEEDQSYFSRQVMSAGWLSFAAYERFLNATRAEVELATGESGEEFDLRNIRESGGRMLMLLYKFMLFWFKPTTTLSRLPTLSTKVFDQGKIELLENTPGRCIMRHTGPKELRDHARRYIIPGVVFLLEMASAKDIKSRILKDEEGEYDFTLEGLITYQHDG